MTTWEPLFYNELYEISTTYPFPIRNIRNQHVKREFDLNGYKSLHFERRLIAKHRLIALQWLPNPDNLPEVHHKNGDTYDNHLLNLMWVSTKTNSCNKFRYKNREIMYYNALSDDAIEVPVYGDWQFDDLWFDNGRFYHYTGLAYRELPELEINGGQLVTNACDINGNNHLIYYSKFHRLYGF
jgi:hypothetical protein